jgi:ABC-type nitrate/sulfonate/bicarbonate transport system substrate-binding protein
MTVVAVASIGIFWLHQRTTAQSIDASTKSNEISLRLNGPFSPQYAGVMVAATSGLFERAGLGLEIKSVRADTDGTTLVSSGVDTIGIARSDEFLVARFKGAPVVAFAAGFLESPVVFYVLEKSGIHTPLDFIGKRIVRQAGQDTAIVYDALLAKLQISRGQIREVSKESNIAALIDGSLDVLPGHVGIESYDLQQQRIPYNVIYPYDYGVHMPGTVYFTTEDTIRSHPFLIQKFLDAVIAGWKLTYADYTKSVPLISAYDVKALPPDRVLFELKEQRDVVFPLGRRFTEFDDTQWKSLRDILINERMIDDTIDMSKAVNYDFLREAYRKPISFGK